MNEGDDTNWYLIGMGNELDIHTVHFHGETFIFKMNHHHRGDVYDLIPTTFQTIELVAFNPGTWLLHCHVHNHIQAGMETTYTIIKAENEKNIDEKKTTTKGNGRTELQFFGQWLDLEEADSLLQVLFFTGIVLLFIVLTFMSIVLFQGKKAYYHFIGHRSMESL
ncbi:ferroxidase HEPHL1-like [Crotalus tigris]|uniref:ferroxidase HEPHL1-like n=1 Tax=Crotalus tigris TaxID=88082 RepID=UPI00192F62CD|nr:ferroxidase HEPHL1-like [Crotalus tigris]